MFAMNKLEIQEKLDEMDKIYSEWSHSKEELHIEFDRILLECVPTEIKNHYNKIEEQVKGFWYA